MAKKSYLLFLIIAVLMLSACAPKSDVSKDDPSGKTQNEQSESDRSKNNAQNNSSKEDSPEVAKEIAENIDFFEYGKIIKSKMEAQQKLEETLETMTVSEIKDKAERGELDIAAIVGDEYVLNSKVENTLFTAEYMKNPLQREEVIERQIRITRIK